MPARTLCFLMGFYVWIDFFLICLIHNFTPIKLNLHLLHSVKLLYLLAQRIKLSFPIPNFCRFAQFSTTQYGKRVKLIHVRRLMDEAWCCRERGNLKFIRLHNCLGLILPFVLPFIAKWTEWRQYLEASSRAKTYKA